VELFGAHVWGSPPKGGTAGADFGEGARHLRILAAVPPGGQVGLTLGIVRTRAAEVHGAAAALPVEFSGCETDVYPAMANLDLLPAPSMAHEATTRVILELFAAAIPVIAFRSGGIPEVVRHGVDGLLAGSAAEMARLAIGLLTDGLARLRTNVAGLPGKPALQFHRGSISPRSSRSHRAGD